MPLMFDMPYEDLLTYTGTNPRPDAFDEFWDKGLAELAAVDPQVELVPAAFSTPFARCEHLYFTGIVTNGGVASTVRDAHVREFHSMTHERERCFLGVQ